jgi:hypothetical protein
MPPDVALPFAESGRAVHDEPSSLGASRGQSFRFSSGSSGSRFSSAIMFGWTVGRGARAGSLLGVAFSDCLSSWGHRHRGSRGRRTECPLGRPPGDQLNVDSSWEEPTRTKPTPISDARLISAGDCIGAWLRFRDLDAHVASNLEGGSRTLCRDLDRAPRRGSPRSSSSRCAPPAQQGLSILQRSHGRSVGPFVRRWHDTMRDLSQPAVLQTRQGGQDLEIGLGSTPRS